ncbi:MAG: glycerol-3-phosphate acyltransferase [Oscillospiraceae bacterium]|nr:glycerol-3-phosphate acyltransferase [Oscillospiraceae bacterium]
MGYFLTVLGAYLLGCSNLAWYISKIKRVDIRTGGSGNLGASNATVLLGWHAGIAVALHDIGKSALAVILARLLFPGLPHISAVAGVASVLGHIFPFYLKFKGGKGFASYIGMTLALNWKLALVVAVLVLLITVITDYIVLGTTMTILTVPVYLGIAEHSLLLALILCIATCTILYKHRMNYVRICRGTEIGLRSALKGKHRIK